MDFNPHQHLLLISSSVVYGKGYLDHAEGAIRDLLGHRQRVLFVPYALADHAGYAAKAAERFAAMGYRLESIHTSDQPQKSVADAEAIFIGGGNTFRLLTVLYEKNLLAAIRQRVGEGAPYIGSSAGTVVSCPAIKTTNDMPIVQPPSLEALGLLPFQINPHYLDPLPSSTHMGETREERLLQFLEENTTPVVGLREGAFLRVENGSVMLQGAVGARMFLRGLAPFEVAPGSKLDEWVL